MTMTSRCSGFSSIESSDREKNLRDTAGKGTHNYAFDGGAIGKVTDNEVRAALNAQFRATGKGQVPAYEIREIRQKAYGSANQQPETSLYTNHNVMVPFAAVMSSSRASASSLFSMCPQTGILAESSFR
ncbi:hypothetical protein AtubIFM55763_005827 [Aspergillus tubingensis]|nr:hypothetical protein AtubIFM55763_005827 [Aspergillus tubingensis]